MKGLEATKELTKTNDTGVLPGSHCSVMKVQHFRCVVIDDRVKSFQTTSLAYGTELSDIFESSLVHDDICEQLMGRGTCSQANCLVLVLYRCSLLTEAEATGKIWQKYSTGLFGVENSSQQFTFLYVSFLFLAAPSCSVLTPSVELIASVNMDVSYMIEQGCPFSLNSLSPAFNCGTS